MRFIFLTINFSIINYFVLSLHPKINNLIFIVIIMVTISVLLRFANKCEWFDPYFIEATTNGIGFNADKKYLQYIIATFSNLDCVVSVSDSFDPNSYYYVIQ